MLVLEKLYPGYEIAKHKGYGTKTHLEKLQQLGVTPHHRKSFAPIKKLL
jgi:ribonuclease HII